METPKTEYSICNERNVFDLKVHQMKRRVYKETSWKRKDRLRGEDGQVGLPVGQLAARDHFYPKS